MAETLEARVKQGYMLKAIIAFSGFEFIQGDWRRVPAGFEEQAKKHSLLEVRKLIMAEKELIKPIAIKQAEAQVTYVETKHTAEATEPAPEVTEESSEEGTEDRPRRSKRARKSED